LQLISVLSGPSERRQAAKMDYTAGAVVVALVFIAGGAVALHAWINRRKAGRLLGARPALDHAAFGQAYFADSPQRAAIATRVREVLSRHVPYSIGGLAPDDRFVADLRMDELDSMSTVEFVLDIEHTFSIKVPDEAAGSILTFRQLVEYVESHVPNGRGAAPEAGRITTR
jgi:acyl carrier protein